MEYLPKGFTLEVPEGCFPLSTDSMLLAHFCRLPRKAKVLDLGAGCGTLGLLLCAKDPNCTVTGIERDETAHLAALENIRANGLDRLESICADLRQIHQQFQLGSFDCCVSNPPYFSGGLASVQTPTARREDHCTAADLMKSASNALKFGGDFFLVHKPERLADLITRAAACQLEAKRLMLVRHKEGGPVMLILLQFRKGGKPGLIWEEASLFDSHHLPTAFYRSVYHIDDTQ